ncbi:DNA-methyltransferase [Leptospira sp. SA-E8]|uniref:DNA-methyltransferase n=1 Tax=Leptospira sp. SA-E8 TaxID=3422259 RepID=UPI003EB78926
MAKGSLNPYIESRSKQRAKIFKKSNSLTAMQDYSLFAENCEAFLDNLTRSKVKAKLIVTSPPYNIGKAYEKRAPIKEYLKWQKDVIQRIIPLLTKDGHVCWQVGNYVDNGHVQPLDIYLHPLFEAEGLTLRNRIVWVYNHGLHCSRRFSGRYETILWYTLNNKDNYTFNLDSVRVPSKYPNKKHFKGPKAGQRSGNPLGKNPGDFWESIASNVWDNIPNVKGQHIEKTEHPCQYPVGLVERLILALTNKGDLVIDPFMGVGSSGVAAALHERHFLGCDKELKYVKTAKQRIDAALNGTLTYRPHDKALYIPSKREGTIQLIK